MVRATLCQNSHINYLDGLTALFLFISFGGLFVVNTMLKANNF